MTLVPFHDAGPLAIFNEPIRSLNLSGTTVELEQDWSNNGVAGVVWESAILLATHILAHASLVRNKVVLELGAGTGLVAIAAGKAGAKYVAATDLASALPLLQRNTRRNNEMLDRVTVAGVTVDRVTVTELDWTNLERSPSIYDRRFDVVLGADLVYAKELFPALRHTLHHFVQPHTLCLLAAKIRYPKDDAFFETLGSDFDIRILTNQSDSVRIYQLTRRVNEKEL